MEFVTVDREYTGLDSPTFPFHVYFWTDAQYPYIRGVLLEKHAALTADIRQPEKTPPYAICVHKSTGAYAVLVGGKVTFEVLP